MDTGYYIMMYLFSLGCIYRAIYLKIIYMKHTGVCIKRTYWHRHVGYAIFEYELIENGETVVYRNKGQCFRRPKEGKVYKILIHKEDHNKVMAYNELTGILGMGIVALLMALSVFIMPY